MQAWFRQVDRLPLWQRILIAIALLLLVILFLMLISRGIEGPADAETSPVELYAGIEPDVELLALDKEGLREAYLHKVVQLFDVWLRGSAKSDVEISNGLKIARRSYETAAKQIAKREQEIKK